MNRSLIPLFAGASVCLVGFPARGQTCDMLPVLTPHTVDVSMQATDNVPPSLSAGRADVRNVPTPDTGCLSEPVHRCDDINLIDFYLAASDDTTPVDKIGFRLRFEPGTSSGRLPGSLVLPADAVEGVVNGRLTIVWLNPRREPAGYFQLKVVAVDAAGNESAPQTIVVGGSDPGCEAVVPPSAGLAFLALLLAGRGRRRPGRAL